MVFNFMISPIKIWRRQKEMRNNLGKVGVVLTWTRVYVSGEDFKKNLPYFIILVQFKNGQKAFGQLVETENNKITIGTKVVGILRKIRDGNKEDVITYGLKFKQL